MKRLSRYWQVCLYVAVMLGICGHISSAQGSNAKKPLDLPEWLEKIPISAQPTDGFGGYWYQAPEDELRQRAKRELQRLNDEKPELREEALRFLVAIATAIALPEAKPAIQRIAETDPYQKTTRLKGTMQNEYPIRQVANNALSAIDQRLSLEAWLKNRPSAERAKGLIKLLSDRGPNWRWSDSGKPAQDAVLITWLMRHPAESLPLLMKVDSGAPFAGNHGPNPTIETPNRYVRTAAALVIATNKAREGIPYLLELLKDSTCCVETISQRLLPTANGKSAPKNLVRNYPVRDTAAGALKQFGYSVRFVNGQYEATAPKP